MALWDRFIPQLGLNRLGWYGLVFGGMIIMGLLFLLMAAVAHEGLEGFGSVFVGHLGIAFLVTGALAVTDRFLGEVSLIKHIKEVLNLHEEVTSLGLQTIRRSWKEYDGFKDLVEKSPRLSIVLNHGEKWVPDYEIEFAKRFAQDERHTEVFLLNPEGEFTRVLAKKTKRSDVPWEQECEELQRKIRGTLEKIKAWFVGAGERGTLSLYLMDPHFPAHSLYLGSDEAVITLYPTSGKRPLDMPLFVFKKSDKENVYHFFEEDVMELRRLSSRVYPLQ